MDPSRSLPVGKCILAVVLAAAVAAFIVSYALITGVSLPGAGALPPAAICEHQA